MRSMGWLSLRLLVILAAAFPGVLAVPAGQIEAKRVTSPLTDPFYQPPSGFASKAPGAVLRSRPVLASFLGFIPAPVQAFQVLYRTTAINGSAIAAVTTIFKPLGASKDKFVSFHTAYDSSSVICNPSYTYQLGANQTDAITAAEMLILQTYLMQGYIVSSPDYEGPDAAFSPGRLSGMGVLDSMRAVTNYASTLGLSTKTPAIVGVGYSGGAIASGWAAALHSTYAPELPVKGWSAGGTPANLTGTTVFLDGGLFSGFLLPAVAGLAAPSAYGAQLSGLLNSILTPLGRSKLEYARTHCATDDLANAGYASIASTAYQSLGDRLLYNPIVKSVLSKNILGVKKSETPIVPVNLYHAASDEIIPYANATALNTAWCKNGATVKFTNYAAGGHLTTEILGLTAAVQFVADSFAGSVTKGCSQSVQLSDKLDITALGAGLEPLLIGLVDILHQLGQNDTNVKASVAASSAVAA